MIVKHKTLDHLNTALTAILRSIFDNTKTGRTKGTFDSAGRQARFDGRREDAIQFMAAVTLSSIEQAPATRFNSSRVRKFVTISYSASQPDGRLQFNAGEHDKRNKCIEADAPTLMNCSRWTKVKYDVRDAEADCVLIECSLCDGATPSKSGQIGVLRSETLLEYCHQNTTSRPSHSRFTDRRQIPSPNAIS